MAPVISRIHLTDDTGQGEDGTIIDDALFQTLQDNIDGLSGAIETDFQTADAAITTAYKAADTAITAANACVLLRAAAASSSATGGANFDQVQISGLTALDWIEIFWHFQNGGVANVNPIKFATSFEYIGQPLPSLAANTLAQGRAIIRQGVSQPLACGCLSEGMASAARVDNFAYGAITTAWTGSWPLALQALGLPVGSAMNWAWAVYRRKGQ
jgi:hypothetical protein